MQTVPESLRRLLDAEDAQIITDIQRLEAEELARRLANWGAYQDGLNRAYLQHQPQPKPSRIKQWFGGNK